MQRDTCASAHGCHVTTRVSTIVTTRNYEQLRKSAIFSNMRHMTHAASLHSHTQDTREQP